MDTSSANALTVNGAAGSKAAGVILHKIDGGRIEIVVASRVHPGHAADAAQ